MEARVIARGTAAATVTSLVIAGVLGMVVLLLIGGGRDTDWSATGTHVRLFVTFGVIIGGLAGAGGGAAGTWQAALAGARSRMEAIRVGTVGVSLVGLLLLLTRVSAGAGTLALSALAWMIFVGAAAAGAGALARRLEG